MTIDIAPTVKHHVWSLIPFRISLTPQDSPKEPKAALLLTPQMTALHHVLAGGCQCSQGAEDSRAGTSQTHQAQVGGQLLRCGVAVGEMGVMFGQVGLHPSIHTPSSVILFYLFKYGGPTSPITRLSAGSGVTRVRYRGCQIEERARSMRVSSAFNLGPRLLTPSP